MLLGCCKQYECLKYFLQNKLFIMRFFYVGTKTKNTTYLLILLHFFLQIILSMFYSYLDFTFYRTEGLPQLFYSFFCVVQLVLLTLTQHIQIRNLFLKFVNIFIHLIKLVGNIYIFCLKFLKNMLMKFARQDIQATCLNYTVTCNDA